MDAKIDKIIDQILTDRKIIDQILTDRIDRAIDKIIARILGKK